MLEAAEHFKELVGTLFGLAAAVYGMKYLYRPVIAAVLGKSLCDNRYASVCERKGGMCGFDYLVIFVERGYRAVDLAVKFLSVGSKLVAEPQARLRRLGEAPRSALSGNLPFRIAKRGR